MKCTNCHKILKKTSYYKAKPVCPDCFERLRNKDKYCSDEEFKKRMRIGMKAARDKKTGLITLNPERDLNKIPSFV